MRRTTTAIVAATVLLLGHDVTPARARRVTTCCLTIDAEPPAPRDYCFGLSTKTRRLGRLLCRLIGGRPQRRVR